MSRLPYKRGFSFSGYQANVPGAPLPGPRVDIELDAIAEQLGQAGASAYQLAVQNGFVGTEADYLLSLKSTTPGPPGDLSAPITLPDNTVGTIPSLLTGFAPVRTLESFGPCGNGSQAQDQAAWTAALAVCCRQRTQLVLAAGKTYILPLFFNVTALAPATVTPYFHLSAHGATVRIVGAGSGFGYSGVWTVNQSLNQRCRFEGGEYYPDGAGTQTAFKLSFKYTPSTWKKNFIFKDITGMLDLVTNPNVYWKSFISVNNGWFGAMEGVYAFGPAGTYNGNFIELTGLTVSVRLDDFYCQWMDKGIYATNTGTQISGILGTVTGTFTASEKVTGVTSGATAYVAQANSITVGATTYPILLADVVGTFANGETITGGTSGATIVKNATALATVKLPPEGFYFVNGEIVATNDGIHIDNTVDAARKSIGHQISNVHLNTNVTGINANYVDQLFVGTGLYYGLLPSWIGLRLVGCNTCSFSSALQIVGQFLSNTIGVALLAGSSNNTVNCEAVGTINGILLNDSSITKNDIGMRFREVATEIVNRGAPIDYDNSLANLFGNCRSRQNFYGVPTVENGGGTNMTRARVRVGLRSGSTTDALLQVNDTPFGQLWTQANAGGAVSTDGTNIQLKTPDNGFIIYGSTVITTDATGQATIQLGATMTTNCVPIVSKGDSAASTIYPEVFTAGQSSFIVFCPNGANTTMRVNWTVYGRWR